MGTERNVPRTRRGAEAVEAALEERELLERIDEPDAGVRPAGDYDLAWIRDRAGSADVAAGTDVYTPEEALEDVARPVARHDPEDEPLEDDGGYDY